MSIRFPKPPTPKCGSLIRVKNKWPEWFYKDTEYYKGCACSKHFLELINYDIEHDQFVHIRICHKCGHQWIYKEPSPPPDALVMVTR